MNLRREDLTTEPSEPEIEARLATAKGVAALAYADADAAEFILLELAHDPISTVREAASAAMVHLLSAVGAQARIETIVRWTASPEPCCRAVLARALRNRLDEVCVLSTLELLAHDRYAEVRRAACEAAACRIEDAPERCVALLAAAAHDNRRFVRSAAIDGLHKAVELGFGGVAVEALVDCGCDDDVDSADRAVDALADALEPDDALEGFERILDHPEDCDEEVLRHVIADVERVGWRCPARAAALLARLEKHPAAWIRHDARAASSSLRR